MNLEACDTLKAFHEVTGGKRKNREVSDSPRLDIETTQAASFAILEDLARL